MEGTERSGDCGHHAGRLRPLGSIEDPEVRALRHRLNDWYWKTLALPKGAPSLLDDFVALDPPDA